MDVLWIYLFILCRAKVWVLGLVFRVEVDKTDIWTALFLNNLGLPILKRKRLCINSLKFCIRLLDQLIISNINSCFGQSLSCTFSLPVTSHREVIGLADDSDILRSSAQNNINIISSEHSIVSFPTFGFARSANIKRLFPFLTRAKEKSLIILEYIWGSTYHFQLACTWSFQC